MISTIITLFIIMTMQELLAVAAFLERRNHFFQKFTAEQRLELCRVLELVSIWGRTTLFKQNMVGQAFYIILSGTVDVFVNATDAEHGEVRTGAEGTLVNTLVAGSSFGERALDSDTNLRTATVVTCESLTELLVISREDYHSLVSVMVQGEISEKCALLRKTLVFKDCEFSFLVRHHYYCHFCHSHHHVHHHTHHVYHYQHDLYDTDHVCACAKCHSATWRNTWSRRSSTSTRG